MTRPARMTPLADGWAWLWCLTRCGSLVGMTVSLDELDVTLWAHGYRLVAADGVGVVA